jgi:hypothetical protein
VRCAARLRRLCLRSRTRYRHCLPREAAGFSRFAIDTRTCVPFNCFVPTPAEAQPHNEERSMDACSPASYSNRFSPHSLKLVRLFSRPARQKHLPPEVGP